MQLNISAKVFYSMQMKHNLLTKIKYTFLKVSIENEQVLGYISRAFKLFLISSGVNCAWLTASNHLLMTRNWQHLQETQIYV